MKKDIFYCEQWSYGYKSVFIVFVAGLPRKPKLPLQTGTQLTLAVFPKPPVLFQPGKAALYYPSLRQYCKTVQFVSFGNLYLRTNQLLYRRSKCLTRVTTVSKDFLYRTKIIPPTFQCHQAAFSIRNIRRRYRKGMRARRLAVSSDI